MKMVAVLVVAGALLLSGGRWESPVPGRFEAVIRGQAGVSAMRVVLTDTTGLVRRLEAGGHAAGDGLSNERGRTETLVVSVLGGRCDDFWALGLASDGGRYRLRSTVVSTPFHEGTWCGLLVGIPRTVTLFLHLPIDAALVEFEAH